MRHRPQRDGGRRIDDGTGGRLDADAGVSRRKENRCQACGAAEWRAVRRRARQTARSTRPRRPLGDRKVFPRKVRNRSRSELDNIGAVVLRAVDHDAVLAACGHRRPGFFCRSRMSSRCLSKARLKGSQHRGTSCRDLPETQLQQLRVGGRCVSCSRR